MIDRNIDQIDRPNAVGCPNQRSRRQCHSLSEPDPPLSPNSAWVTDTERRTQRRQRVRHQISAYRSSGRLSCRSIPYTYVHHHTPGTREGISNLIKPWDRTNASRPLNRRLATHTPPPLPTTNERTYPEYLYISARDGPAIIRIWLRTK